MSFLLPLQHRAVSFTLRPQAPNSEADATCLVALALASSCCGNRRLHRGRRARRMTALERHLHALAVAGRRGSSRIGRCGQNRRLRRVDRHLAATRHVAQTRRARPSPWRRSRRRPARSSRHTGADRPAASRRVRCSPSAPARPTLMFATGSSAALLAAEILGICPSAPSTSPASGPARPRRSRRTD